MSSSKVLYEKGRRMLSDSEHDEGVEEDVWDDRKLNDAYDKALKIANAEVAKRVAMSTNSHQDLKEDHPKNKKEKQSCPSSSKQSHKKPTEWKPGMACRAIYEIDGLEYEAFILRKINEKESLVRFLGYDNCEIVPTSTLKPSLGSSERQQQIELASNETSEDTEQYSNHECDSDRLQSPENIEMSFQKRKKSSKNKNSQKQVNFNELPNFPFAMPTMSMMPNLGSLDLPMPPPPPMAMPTDRVDSEDQAISSMLLSWYMSGYYTGLYQGMKRAQQGRKRV